MYKNFEFKEVTPENESQYLDQIVDLEVKVLEHMLANGKEGQLFTTGKEDISNYIHSKQNHVIIATQDEKVLAAVYITRGQIPYTYNDITKYFKFGDGYKEYVKSQYQSKEYKQIIKQVYSQKIEAYIKARDIILEEQGNNLNGWTATRKSKEIEKLVYKELSVNGFHEKSIIRDNLNKYMAEEMEKLGNKSNYDKFYWLSLNDVAQEIYNTKVITANFGSNVESYEKILKMQKYTIYEKPEFAENKYYKSNTENSIEIDTYITQPSVRKNGLARILVNEGIRKCIKDYRDNSKSSETFLCSTLHKDNISSRYVSEFFGLTDNLFVKRREGRDREVHIYKIENNDYSQYLQKMDKKIAVLYGYNPRDVKVTINEELRIVKDQLYYEVEEFVRLKKMKKTENKFDKVVFIKKGKIQKLQTRIDELEEKQFQR